MAIKVESIQNEYESLKELIEEHSFSLHEVYFDVFNLGVYKRISPSDMTIGTIIIYRIF